MPQRKSERDKAMRRASKAEAKAKRRKILNVVAMAAIAVLLGLAVYAVTFGGAQRPTGSLARERDLAADIEGRSQAECPTRTGEPWEYDAETRCHFDPGHGHWHLGRPPGLADRAAAPAAEVAPEPTPEPFAEPAPEPFTEPPPGSDFEE